jgi:hypothetical protein
MGGKALLVKREGGESKGFGVIELMLIADEFWRLLIRPVLISALVVSTAGATWTGAALTGDVWTGVWIIGRSRASSMEEERRPVSILAAGADSTVTKEVKVDGSGGFRDCLMN